MNTYDNEEDLKINFTNNKLQSLDVILFHLHIHSFMQSTQVNKYGLIPQCIKKLAAEL